MRPPMLAVGSMVALGVATAAAQTPPADDVTFREKVVVRSMPRTQPAEGQEQTTTSPPSWGDVGVYWSPYYLQIDDLEVGHGTPPGVWVTWGTGKFRLQVDYQRPRQQWPSNTRGIENHQGQESLVLRDSQYTKVSHVGEASLYWRVLEHPRLSPHLLFGFQYLNLGERLCVATGEPAPRVLGDRKVPGEYQVAFAPGEEQRCGDDPLTHRHYPWFVAGGGIDLALSSRVFARVQAQPFQVRIGVGVRF